MALKNASVMTILSHAAGLPVSEDIPCELYYCVDHIEIIGNGIEFKLDLSKIHDICIRTSTEIHKQYVSSAGGAVGGAMLFGALGALIYGRVHQKQITDTRRFLIFTYSSGGEIEYIAFNVTGDNKYAKAFVNEFGKRPQNARIVDL
jgi:hypothetical protein